MMTNRLQNHQRDHLIVSSEDILDLDTQHQVVISIKQKGISELDRILLLVSDPSSNQYGSYLTRDQVHDLTFDEVSWQTVVSFLKSRGFQLSYTSPYHEFVSIIGSVHKVNSVFRTTLRRFTLASRSSPSSQSTFLRADSYELPPELKDHVEDVFDLVDFPVQNQLLPRYSLESEIQSDETQITSHAKRSPSSGLVSPTTLQSVFGIPNPNVTVGPPAGSQCIYATSGQSYSPADLGYFQDEYGLPRKTIASTLGAPGHNRTAVCNTWPERCMEGNLDVQYLLGVSPSPPTTFWYDNSTSHFVLNWAREVSSLSKPPLVISISYGVLESRVSRGYSNAFDREALKLAVQGVTILVSSGDDGVAGYTARDNTLGCGYYPMWPATSAYVTAVGGIQGPEYGASFQACSSKDGGVITSGGGFSNLVPQPSWQKASVAKYLSSFSKATAPFQGTSLYQSYRVAGRAYPDVSFAAHNYRIRVGGNWALVSGTSAAAPVLAGMVSLINAERLERGRPPLGFLNPALYANGTYFTRDIKSGENKCAAVGSNGQPVCCVHGFQSLAGWDPVTGVGAVDYNAFKNYFLYGNKTDLNNNGGVFNVEFQPSLLIFILLISLVLQVLVA